MLQEKLVFVDSSSGESGDISMAHINCSGVLIIFTSLLHQMLAHVLYSEFGCTFKQQTKREGALDQSVLRS